MGQFPGTLYAWYVVVRESQEVLKVVHVLKERYIVPERHIVVGDRNLVVGRNSVVEDRNTVAEPSIVVNIGA